MATALTRPELTRRLPSALRVRSAASVVLGLLAITVSAEEDQTRKLFHEGAVYPSPHLAPIADPYVIFYYNSAAFFPPLRWRGWHVPNHMGVAKYDDKKTGAEAIVQLGRRVSSKFVIPEDQRLWEAWTAAGTLPLLHVVDGDRGTEPGLLDIAITRQNAPFGLSFDEFASKHGKQRRAEFIQRFRDIKRECPAFFVTAWVAPFEAITDQLAGARDAIDVFIPETYVGYVKTPPARIKDRVSEARSLGILCKTILGLWVGQRGIAPEVVMPWTADNPATQPDLDTQLTTVRRLAPEMPGVALFMIHPGNVEWLAEYDTVIHEHFYAPAPSVRIADVDKTGKAMHVRVLGRPNPDTQRPVVRYRYFLNATCVRISESSEASIDAGDLSAGEHIVTVHAVDDGHLAGAAQVRVSIDKDGRLTVER